jgi:cellulose synthase/poly-beta-1,6-N-acetylglucosamine synthase-like glycosyltransferase
MNFDPGSLALLQTLSLAERLTQALFDDTFAGIHQLAWFDYALMVPYFLLLSVLAFYGLHRYEMVRLYRKHRNHMPVEPPQRFSQLPRVTIQLPLYNERFVVERLLEETLKIDYPRELLQIQVLDDSTDETHPFTERLVGEYRAQGFPIEYQHRSNRRGFKAGALEEGLQTATGELIAIFDADFVPPRDFLMRTVHYFTDPKVGLVQTRWTYLNRDYNLLTEAQAILLDGHFILEHVARSGEGLFFNFNGTAGVLRKQMIVDAGGWEHDTLTEDADLSYRAQLKGWKFVYLPDVECPSELPVDTHGFQVQQSRWAKGQTQVAIKLLRRILKSEIPFREKLEAVWHLTPNISYPLMVLVTMLMLPVMIVRFYVGWQQMLMLDLPFVCVTFLSVMVFYTYSQMQTGRTFWRSVKMIPVVIAAGVALTLSNTKAVMEAILGIQSGFVRTPKFAIAGKQHKVLTPRYRSRSGWLPWIELGFGAWFLAIVFYAIDTYNFLVIPFMSVFVMGYFWAALTTLKEELRARLAWERQRKLEAVRQS